MYIQVLTFHLTGGNADEVQHFTENAILGLSEFDGYISDTCLTQPESGIFGGMIAWHDWKSLEGFRHSELYAKLMLYRHFGDESDRAFAVNDGDGASRQMELLAVA